ncbi:MAG: TIGR04255 family protein [Planctomycetota bacterium]
MVELDYERRYADPAVVQALVDIQVSSDRGSDTNAWWSEFKPGDDYIKSASVAADEVEVSGTPYEGITATEARRNLIGKLWADANHSREVHVLNGPNPGVAQMITLLRRGEDANRPGWLGWDKQLLPDTLAAWAAFREVHPRGVLSYVGVRYVNRFELPASDNLSLAKYFRTCPNISADTPGIGLRDFLLQLDTVQEKPGVFGRLVQTTVPPKQPGRYSVVLDLDVGWKVTPTHSLADNELGDMLQKLHAIENRLFETSITESTRQLMSPRTQSLTNS